MVARGIDVSTWQGNIDFNKVKASGIDFVIIRAGYGIGNKDDWFEANYQKAKAARLHVGAYWYSYANSSQDARAEARSFGSVLKGKQFDYPVYFDMEEKSQLARGVAFCSELVTAFCTEMEKQGYYAGFYTSLYYLNTVISNQVKNRFTLWIAQWANRCTYAGPYGLWQYSSHGSIPGIAGRVDMNYSYIDFPSIIVGKGFNGYGKQAKPTPAKKSVDVLAQEVLKGLWGNGNDRKSRLQAAGFDYNAVQRKVNELMGQGSALIKTGDHVQVVRAITYTGQPFTCWYNVYTVMELHGDRAVIGVVTAAINVNNLRKI